jgi:hypothetical protein
MKSYFTPSRIIFYMNILNFVFRTQKNIKKKRLKNAVSQHTVLLSAVPVPVLTQNTSPTDYATVGAVVGVGGGGEGVA